MNRSSLSQYVSLQPSNAIIRLVFLFIPFIITAKQATSQITKNHYINLEISYLSGNVLNTNRFVNGDNLAQRPIEAYSGFTAKLGLQNPGTRLWQKLYKSPYYGLGMSTVYLGSNEIGNPVSAFAYLGLPLIRSKYFELYFEYQQGLAANWIVFDPISNPKNIVVGSKFTTHSAIALRAFGKIGKNVDLVGSLGFTHYSNGTLKLPNSGLNLMGSTLGIRYHFRERHAFTATKEKLPVETKRKLASYLSFAFYQSSLDSNYYSVLGVSAVYYVEHNLKFRNGLGVDANYWFGQAVIAKNDPSDLVPNQLNLGFLWQPEMAVGRLRFVGGLGIYALHQNFGNFNQLYQRLGIRYNFTKQLSFGMNVRAIDFNTAEFTEYQLGFHF